MAVTCKPVGPPSSRSGRSVRAPYRQAAAPMPLQNGGQGRPALAAALSRRPQGNSHLDLHHSVRDRRMQCSSIPFRAECGMVSIITVTDDSVETHGFFCKMSARKSQAWQDKRAWLRARFAEGLQLRLLGDGERGFVEFIPGHHAWRSIEGAADFVVIHCLWVVGKSKGKGHSTALLDEVEAWARQNGFRGVAALTSTGNWLISPGVLERRGYRVVDTALPGFSLLAHAFEPGPDPRLSGGWIDKALSLGPGLVVLRSAQCPYLEDAAAHARAAAGKLGLSFFDRKIETADDLRRLAPTPYGVFALVLDGVLISSTFLLEKDILARIGQRV